MAYLVESNRIQCVDKAQGASLGEFQVTRKRGRQNTPLGTASQDQPPKKGPGRPSYQELASRDPMQARLQLSALEPTAATIVPNMDTDMEDLSLTQ